MDAPKPDELSEVERRLSAWRPSADGLTAEAVLFAAGRASARHGTGRYVWPAVAGGFALLAALLGGWGVSERAERQALARHIREKQQAPAPVLALVPADTPAPKSEPRADSMLAARRSLNRDFDAWMAHAGTLPVVSDGPAPPSRPVLHAGQRNVVLDP